MLQAPWIHVFVLGPRNLRCRVTQEGSSVWGSGAPYPPCSLLPLSLLSVLVAPGQSHNLILFLLHWATDQVQDYWLSHYHHLLVKLMSKISCPASSFHYLLTFFLIINICTLCNQKTWKGACENLPSQPPRHKLSSQAAITSLLLSTTVSVSDYFLFKKNESCYL